MLRTSARNKDGNRVGATVRVRARVRARDRVRVGNTWHLLKV
jgi:hypothetical protein